MTDYDVIVGQPIRYYVGVLASAKPTSVTINGEQATELTDYNVVPQPSGIATSKTVWYIDWSQNTKDTYPMEVVTTVDGMTDTRVVGSVKVAGLTVGNNTTSLTTDGATMYVLRNNSYTNTYLTAVNGNLSASANAEPNYYNLFVFENNTRIKSVALGEYCNGTNGTISFNTTGTQYTFGTNNNGRNNRIYYGNNYIRQTSDTNVTINNSNSNRDWQICPVTLYMP